LPYQNIGAQRFLRIDRSTSRVCFRDINDRGGFSIRLTAGAVTTVGLAVTRAESSVLPRKVAMTVREAR
jgi:hypothetical protein